MICDEDPLRRRPRESTARRKRQERCVWMARKMTEWPSKRGPITKIMPSDGCIGDTVPWRWESGTISTNLDGIWGMPVQTRPSRRLGRVASTRSLRGLDCRFFRPDPVSLTMPFAGFRAAEADEHAGSVRADGDAAGCGLAVFAESLAHSGAALRGHADARAAVHLQRGLPRAFIRPMTRPPRATARAPCRGRRSPRPSRTTRPPNPPPAGR